MYLLRRLPSLLVLFAVTSAQATQQDTLIERVGYSVPSWSDAAETTDVARFYATREEYVAAAGDDDYLLEKLRYRSDGLSVVAYLYRARDERQRPVIVFNRGSYVRGDIAPELLPMFHRLAREGFAILAPMYRGSDGGEGRDELGGADVADLMTVSKLIAELPSLDRNNVFLYGESRGGMMVFQAIRDGFPARAAATFGAFTNLEAMIATEQGQAMADSLWPDFAERKERIVERRSAIRWPKKLTIPLLLMHGSDDHSVSPTQTLQLAIELAEAGREFGAIIFPGGGHVLMDQRHERDRQAVDHFRRYIVQ